MCCIGFGTGECYTFQSLMLFCHQCFEHFGVGDELFAVATRDAVGLIEAINIGFVFAFKQIVL